MVLVYASAPDRASVSRPKKSLPPDRASENKHPLMVLVYASSSLQLGPTNTNKKHNIKHKQAILNNK